MAILTNWLNGDLFTSLRDKVNNIVAAVNFLAGGTVGQLPIKSSSTDFAFTFNNSVLPDSGGANIKIKKISIGDWNMDTNISVTVAHGVSDYKKILSVSVIVRDDFDTFYATSPWIDPTSFVPAAAYNNCLLTHGISGSTDVTLTRQTGSFFDTINFDSTSYNRGFITIIYEG